MIHCLHTLAMNIAIRTSLGIQIAYHCHMYFHNNAIPFPLFRSSRKLPTGQRPPQPTRSWSTATSWSFLTCTSMLVVWQFPSSSGSRTSTMSHTEDSPSNTSATPTTISWVSQKLNYYTITPALGAEFWEIKVIEKLFHEDLQSAF